MSYIEDYPTDDEEVIFQESCWPIVTAFFEEKKLVRQQLDSFDRFSHVTIQAIVDADRNRHLELEVEPQYTGANDDLPRRYSIEFRRVSIAYPTLRDESGPPKNLRPNEARLRNMTYSSDMFVDVYKTDTIGTGKDAETSTMKFEKVPFGKLPVMLKSNLCHLAKHTENEMPNFGECPYDQGGYFIISGGEKVLIAQERMAFNYVHVFQKAMPNKYSFIAEIRSQSEMGGRPASACYVKMHSRLGKGDSLGRTIHVQLSYIRSTIPVAIVFRALGVTSDAEIIRHIVYDIEDTEMLEAIIPSIQEATDIHSQSAALRFIGARGDTVGLFTDKKKIHAREVLEREFLPHIGIGADYDTPKAFFLGYMVHRLLLVALGRRPQDDRDHFGKKRVDLAGPLLANLFRGLFRRLRKEIQVQLRKSIERRADFNVTRAINVQTMTNGLTYSIATGNWIDDRKRFMEAKSGVSQVLNRLTYASTLSHLRRLNTPIGRESKLSKPRQLHNTTWGILCPAETPEGQACGLVKNLALMAYITYGRCTSSHLIYQQLNDYGYFRPLTDIAASDLKTLTKVFVNGNWVGVSVNPEMTVENFKALRKDLQTTDDSLPLCELSVVWDIQEQEIRILSDPGRICRPLFRTEQGPGDRKRLVLRKSDLEALSISQTEGEKDNQSITWESLLKAGIVEYIDTEEEETTMIAMSVNEVINADIKTFTHCEIHPSMILGVCASLIPFPDHNQSPRNTYQSAMGKQAMGVYATNYIVRMDTTANVLFYPQKPLCETKALNYMSFRELPAGQNAIVAIACYSGYNQEDSLIMNQSSIDRGLFRSTNYRSYTEIEKKPILDHGPDELIEKPGGDVRGLRHGNYNKLDDDGIAAPGERVVGNDIIVGKTVSIRFDPDEMNQNVKKYSRRDASLSMRGNEQGIIDTVMISTKLPEGHKIVKLRVRSIRVPHIGDKFASRHGQKGTCGMTYRQEDMPFTAEGITPDIIVNPHAIPSRMTIGHLIECLLSKVAAVHGYSGADATAFNDVRVDIVSNQLKAMGYQQRGFEVLYNGHTGRKLTAQVYFGPTYYQRLKHMVDDKIHARARGPYQILTRQPMEGRAREGGLRFGEMERDCIIAHGAAQFLKERLMDNSDAYRVHICDLCGLLAIAHLKKGTFECKGCDNTTQISQVYIPYATKLLFQELMSMCIAPRLVVV